jgi:hypothetical protein
MLRATPLATIRSHAREFPKVSIYRQTATNFQQIFQNIKFDLYFVKFLTSLTLIVNKMKGNFRTPDPVADLPITRPSFQSRVSLGLV